MATLQTTTEQELVKLQKTAANLVDDTPSLLNLIRFAMTDEERSEALPGIIELCYERNNGSGDDLLNGLPSPYREEQLETRLSYEVGLGRFERATSLARLCNRELTKDELVKIIRAAFTRGDVTQANLASSALQNLETETSSSQ